MKTSIFVEFPGCAANPHSAVTLMLHQHRLFFIWSFPIRLLGNSVSLSLQHSAGRLVGWQPWPNRCPSVPGFQLPPPSTSTFRKRLLLTCPSSHEQIDYGPLSFRPRVDINLCSRSPLAATWPAILCLCSPDPAAGNLIRHQPQETQQTSLLVSSAAL